MSLSVIKMLVLFFVQLIQSYIINERFQIYRIIHHINELC